MSQRYSLRFESGERSGETIALSGQTFSVGRKSDNDLQIVEGSISGRHAELVIDESGVLLRDLGSTNGTKVGGERIIETRLANGAEVLFGQVEMHFMDSQARPATALAAEPETLHVSAERIASVRKGSRLGLVLVGLAAVGAGGAWWYLNGGGAQSERVVRPVEAVAGNLLAKGYSFEGDVDTWTARDSVAASFRRANGARASGERGISASLESGETAIHESPTVELPAEKKFTVRGVARCTDGARARLGVQLSSSAADGPAPFSAWGPPVEPGGAFQTVEWITSPPPGYDRARVLLLGRATGADGGRVEADDISLALAGGVQPKVKLDEYVAWSLGTPAPAGVIVLSRLDEALVTGLQVLPETPGPGRVSAGLAASVSGGRIRVAPEGGGEATLVFRIEPLAIEAGLASMSDAATGGGYAKHHDDFERSEVTDLLLGSGMRLVRLQFDEPARITADAHEGGYRVRAEVTSGGFEMQVTFQAERASALALASEARAAERAGMLGDCLAKWGELLDKHPYEEAAVNEAETKRSELIQAGLAENRGVAREIERARFFRLVDLFRLCRRQAEAVAVRYAGSEVEAAARVLMAEVDQELEGLEADLDRHEVARLESILTVFDAQEWKSLSAEVRTYLRDQYGEER